MTDEHGDQVTDGGHALETLEAEIARVNDRVTELTNDLVTERKCRAEAVATVFGAIHGERENRLKADDKIDRQLLAYKLKLESLGASSRSEQAGVYDLDRRLLDLANKTAGYDADEVVKMARAYADMAKKVDALMAEFRKTGAGYVPPKGEAGGEWKDMGDGARMFVANEQGGERLDRLEKTHQAFLDDHVRRIVKLEAAVDRHAEQLTALTGRIDGMRGTEPEQEVRSEAEYWNREQARCEAGFWNRMLEHVLDRQVTLGQEFRNRVAKIALTELAKLGDPYMPPGGREKLRKLLDVSEENTQEVSE